MAKNRYIDTKFWDDGYIIKLDPTEKLLFLYLLTNTLTNIAGIYEITTRRIIFDTDINEDKLWKILKKFETDKRVYYIDGWIIMCNFPKYQHYEKSPKIREGIESILAELPDEIIKSMDTLSIPYLYLSNYSILFNSIKSNSISSASEFDFFWKEYPKKKEKSEALKLWQGINPNKKLTEKIIEGVKKYKETDEWQKEGGRFIPYPKKFLENKKWEDEIIIKESAVDKAWKSAK